jgi:flagellar protein FliJ
MESFASLTLLMDQAESARDAQQTVLRNFEATAAHAQAQAEQLLTYRGQYEERWSTHFRQAGAIGLLQCVQGFSQRLEQAIGHQSQASAQAQARVAQARSQLIALEQRLAAVRKLIERRRAEQRRVADRREQRSTDEAAQRRPSGSRFSPSVT